VWWTVRCAGAARGAPGTAPVVWPLAGAGLLMALLPVLPSGQTTLTALLAAAALWGGWSGSLARTGGDRNPTLPGLAMGLMMGSLWLASQWCLGPGWTTAQAVALHGGLMLVIPILTAAIGRAVHHEGTVAAWVPATLLAAGALFMAGADAGGWRLAGMVLLVLAWTLGARTRLRTPTAPSQVPAGLGPLLLLAVGWFAPTQGPAAMQAAWAMIALLAVAGLLPWRPLRPAVPLEPPRWSDAS
jgi:hypothetical protein